MKRRVFAGIMSLCLMLSTLSGCGEGASGSGGTSEGDDSIVLEFWTTPVMAEEYFVEAIEEYTTEIAPNVKINLSYVPFNGVDEKVNVALGADQFPDLYLDGSVRVGPLAAKGVAATLNDYITPDYNIDEINPAAMEMAMIGDDIKMFVVATNASVLMLNKALFEEAGAEEYLPDLETGAWSREDFEKACEMVGALGDDIYGMGLACVAYTHDRYVDGYIYNDGDVYTDSTYSEITYNTPKNVENFEWLIRVANSDYAVPGCTGNEDKALLELFKQGKLGVMNYNFGYYDTVMDAVAEGSVDNPVEILFAHYPTTDGEVGRVWLSNYGIIVKEQEDTAKKDAAAQFAMWLSSGKSEAVNEGLYVEEGQSPVRESLKSLIQEPELQKLCEMPVYTAGNIFCIPNYFELRKTWANQFQPALLGEISAEEALQNFEEEATALIQNNA